MAAPLLDPLVAACFCLLGLVMWRRSAGASAVLMVVTGLAWLLGDVAGALVFLHRGPLTHLLVGYPRNRLRNRLERAVVAFGYLDAAIYPLGRMNGVTLGLAVATIGVLAHGHRAARGAERRARLTSLASSVAVAGSLAVGAAARLVGDQLDQSVLLVYQLSLTATAIALFTDQRSGRWNRSAIRSLVLDLGDAEQPISLRDKLASALGDPLLQVGYAGADPTWLVDEAGRPFGLPPPTPDRRVTVLRENGREIAALVHDRTVLDDPALLGSVTALATIALANVRLQADIVATAARIEASRRRLLEVADTERRQLEAELNSGAQVRLAQVEALLADARNADSLRDQVRICRHALSDFARGVHPRALTDRGLSVALAELAASAPIRVELDVRTGRCDDGVEAAVYYVCAEALTNTAKYADATVARIRVRHDAAWLHVTVTDDGVGGAEPRAGSGLMGLADRLDVLGGTLTVESPPGGGTTLVGAIRLVRPSERLPEPRRPERPPTLDAPSGTPGARSTWVTPRPR